MPGMDVTDRELGIAAAEAGAAVVRSHYGASSTHGASSARVEKGGGDFATAADIEAEQVIRAMLRAARPADAILGEEHGRTGAADAAREWLVDPLCGTLNYAARTTLVGVNVALRTGSRALVGITVDPFTREVFWAEGARACVRRDGVDEPLVPAAGSALVDVNLDTPFPHGPALRAVRLLAAPGFAARFRPRVVSTTLAVAWVAAGRRAAYLTDGDLRDSVHFASGIALCQAAGCVVTGIEGQPLHTGAGGLLAAADPDTHAALLALLAEQTNS